MKKNKVNLYFSLVLLVTGLIWLRSSWGKVSGGEFVSGLGATLEKFAAKNPYPFFKDFLTGVAIPNSSMLGILVMLGEMYAAVSIVGVVAYLLFSGKRSELIKMVLVLGLGTGAFLNLMFYLAAGWMSPSTDGLNLLMMVIQVVGIGWVLKTWEGK